VLAGNGGFVIETAGSGGGICVSLRPDFCQRHRARIDELGRDHPGRAGADAHNCAIGQYGAGQIVAAIGIRRGDTTGLRTKRGIARGGGKVA